MSLGKFVGQRLRDARIARGMTASMLAERVDVSPGAISQYELRNVEPRALTLTRLSEVLELPEPYFLRASLSRDPAPHLYRSRAAATKRAREAAEVRHAWLREIVSTVESYVEFPEPAVFDFGLADEPNELSYEDIEVAAGQVREMWKLGGGPIPNLVSLIETMGCAVTSFAFGAETLSAFSQASEGRPYIVLNSDESACVRGRFNAAHELGHIVLHRHVPASTASRPEMHELMEKQAHRFASAFLFPEKSFADEVYSLSLDSLVKVKSRWHVSVQMIIRRALDLELVSQEQYQRMFRDLSRRGYRTREPLDDTLPREVPSLLGRSIRMILEERVTTREDLLQKLPYSPIDIEILTGLPRGYLHGEGWGQLAELKLRNKTTGNSSSDKERGQLLPFRRP